MTRLIFTILWALTLSAFSASNPAQAEGPAASPSFSLDLDDSALRYLPSGETDESLAPSASTPRECKPRYMAGPAVGMVAGPGAIVLGWFMIGAGYPTSRLLFTSSERTGGEKALTAGGAILFAAGTGALLYSIGKLVKNRRERKRVCGSEQPARVQLSP